MPKARIKSGLIAYDALRQTAQRPRQRRAARDARRARRRSRLCAAAQAHPPGRRERDDGRDRARGRHTIPDVPVLFWSFRLMVGARLLVHRAVRGRVLPVGAAAARPLPLFLWVALFSLPLPWIAIELGWIVAEYGRQPWAIEGVLPTFLGVSSTDASNVLFSLHRLRRLLFGAARRRSSILMLKYIRLGPDETLGHAVALPAHALRRSEIA